MFLLLAALPAACHASLIWDSNLGNALAPGSFSPDATNGVQSVALQPGYEFPFMGTSYDSIFVTTFGSIWLGFSGGAQCCEVGNMTVALDDFQNSPARIAPAWAALRPDLPGGTINFNEITDGNGARTDITYSQVATNQNQLSERVSFQLQLYASGKVVFSYMTVDPTDLGSNQAILIGITAGQGQPASSADLISLLATGAPLPHNFYDYLSINDTPGCATGSCLNLSGDSLVFTPTANGWQLAAATPEPSLLIPIGGILVLIAVTRIRQLRINKC